MLAPQDLCCTGSTSNTRIPVKRQGQRCCFTVGTECTLDTCGSRQRKVFKLQPTSSCVEVIVVDVDRRDSAALQERHYTRLLTEGCSSHPPATTSTPFGAPFLGDELFPADGENEFFRHLNMLRQQLSHLLDGIENKTPSAGHDPASAAHVFVVYQALRRARMSSNAWQDLHADDRRLVERAEQVLRMDRIRTHSQV